MSPLILMVVIFLISVAAGTFGALLGLGGGLIVVPALTLGLGIDIRYAVGASIVCIIATSSGAAAAYVREGLTNIRVAMFLETGTTVGGLCGAFLAGLISPSVLYIIFGSFLGVSAWAMLRKRQESAGPEEPNDRLSETLALHGSYQDATMTEPRRYRVSGSLPALGLMLVAGLASGMLGIGSGALKVPAMDLLMRLPLKVSTATSNFMIGVTAAASAGVYFARGDIDPFVAGPVALGVVLGALLGARLLARVNPVWLRKVFVVALLLVAVQMFIRGLS